MPNYKEVLTLEKLLTQKNLATRWQVSEKTISKWRTEGTLTVCKGVPVIRFTEQHISELEGIKVERFSPLEHRRLENEIEKLRSLLEHKNNKITGFG